MIIVLVILSLLIYLNISGLFKFLTKDAEEKLIMNFIYGQTSSYIQIYSKNLEYKIMQGMNSIQNINTLFELVQRNNMNFSQNSEKCLQDDYFQNSIINYCQYCYGNFDCSKNIQMQNQYGNDFRKLSNILTTTIAFQIELNLYFTSISSDCYFSTCPGSNFTNFVPSSRKWFQNHLDQINSSQFVISEPYVNFLGGVYISGTTSIYDQNKNAVGIGAIDLNFSAFYQFSYEDIDLLVIDKQGRVLISSYYAAQTKDVISLQNESIFGFNETDVKQIISQNQTQENCQLNIPNTICMINKNTNELWYIRSKKITNEYFILLKFNSSAYSNYISLLKNMIEDMQQLLIGQFIIGIVFTTFISLCIHLISFLLLQKPIDRLINSFNKYLLWGKKINFNLFSDGSQDQLDKLSDAFLRLTNHSKSNQRNKQNTIKQYLQESQYPINYYVNSKIMNTQNRISLEIFENQIQKQKLVQQFFDLYRQQICKLES
ncbi:unnamed protein product [Paramecium octaurelia]|uniref:Cache domain-containing protein n=1 Tax=Paramecium octaurelia TaxID=43137 RepID=A0A8S1W506_PAROT|nr:unnamed protein product [Paramecium octaurelia]